MHTIKSYILINDKQTNAKYFKIILLNLNCFIEDPTVFLSFVRISVAHIIVLHVTAISAVIGIGFYVDIHPMLLHLLSMIETFPTIRTPMLLQFI